MTKQKTKKFWKGLLFRVGIAIVILTHIGIIAMGLPQAALGGHAGINLFAGVIIVISKFM